MKKIVKLVLLLALITNLFVISMADNQKKEIDMLVENMRWIEDNKDGITTEFDNIAFLGGFIAFVYDGPTVNDVSFKYFSKGGIVGFFNSGVQVRDNTTISKNTLTFKEIKKGDLITLGTTTVDFDKKSNLQEFLKNKYEYTVEIKHNNEVRYVKRPVTDEKTRLFYTFFGKRGQYEPIIPKDKVFLTTQKIKLNGVLQNVEGYNIQGENYFKIRDIQNILSKVGVENEILYTHRYESASGKMKPKIDVVNYRKYTPSNNDLTKLSNEVTEAQRTFDIDLWIQGYTMGFTIYNINGSTFFKLRELAPLLRFEVDFDSTTQTVLMTTK